MDGKLLDHGEGACKEFLVFTSAGDNSCLNRWVKGRRNFDLWISYYGDRPGRYRGIGEYYMARKGAKFPALLHAYQNWPELLARYRAILVLDDDLRFGGSDISRLFEIRDEHQLWILQPAFDPRGKNSHLVTIVQPFSKLRFTNFVELGCPLFEKDKLDQFMRVFDPVLQGWGTDWWYIHELIKNNGQIEGRVAVVDEVFCLNPYGKTKDQGSEIERLEPVAARQANWEKIKELQGINVDAGGIVQYSGLPASRDAASLLRSVKVLALRVFDRYSRRFKNQVKRWIGRPI